MDTIRTMAIPGLLKRGFVFSGAMLIGWLLFLALEYLVFYALYANSDFAFLLPDLLTSF